MSDQEFKKYICWNPSRIPIVINKEAIATDRSIFLATHTPFPNIAIKHSSKQISKFSEDGFLKELIESSKNDRHLFSVILGIPGTGKSHLIRWLKERYESENNKYGKQELVLLIQRADNSLKQTLIQILNSEIFSEDTFSDQRKKLEKATSQLSAEGLEESLINNFHLAHIEKRSIQEGIPKSSSERLDVFLLDIHVRRELRRENGPIKRLARFLSGNQTNQYNDEVPTFNEKDLFFSTAVMRKIKGPGINPEARHLAEQLHAREELRHQLANYLNNLLEFAISQTTNLSSDDLKQMFNNIRSELKERGWNLALFIEDITAFTGLDSGLLDILITQHTGESNREFCRLISVIGITDSYYNDRLPDNIRERISIQLELNTKKGEHFESELLANENSIGEMASRYLNAIRLDQDSLDDWEENGCQPEELPNKCEICQYQESCHDGFGFIELSDTESSQSKKIGLYPFNKNSLSTMYMAIDRQKASHTPRSLLNNVIEYVLLSHGELIQTGNFPPKSTEVGNDFSPPLLINPNQRRILDQHNLTSSQKNQTESLAVFWGDRLLESRNAPDGDSIFAGLKPIVYNAFGLPFIGQVLVPSPIVTPEPPPELIPDQKPDPEPERIPQPDPEHDPIVEDIEIWRSGATLKHYEKLINYVAEFLKNAIDWDAYGVSLSLVNDRVKLSHLAIQDQVGKASGNYFLFERSDIFAYALQALHRLKDKKNSPSSLASHLVNLSLWLHEIEDDFREFVEKPHKENKIKIHLDEILAEDLIKLAGLEGSLSENDYDSRNLFRSIISTCEANNSWSNALDLSSEFRSSDWSMLMRRFNRDEKVKVIREEFLMSINCSQRRSQNIRFLDAARLFSILDKFQAKQLKQVEQNDLSDFPAWSIGIQMNNDFNNLLNEIINVEKEDTKYLLGIIKEHGGKSSGDEIKESIDNLLLTFMSAQIAYNEKYSPIDFSTYTEDILTLHRVIEQKQPFDLLLALSATGDFKRRAKNYANYLMDLGKFIGDKKRKLQEDMGGDSESGENAGILYEEVEVIYQDIQDKLDQLISETN